MPHMANLPWIHIYSICLILILILVAFKQSANQKLENKQLSNNKNKKQWMW